MTEETHLPRVLDANKVLKDVATELESQLEVLAGREITDKLWEDRCRISLLITRVNMLRSTVYPHG